MSCPKRLKKAASRVVTADRVEAALEAELGELARRVRQQVDADAERLELRRRLETRQRDAALVQAQRERRARRSRRR